MIKKKRKNSINFLYFLKLCFITLKDKLFMVDKGKKIKKQIQKAIKPFKAFLFCFTFDDRFFGNIVAQICDKNGVYHEVILDRNNILIDQESYPVSFGGDNYKEDIRINELIKHLIDMLQKIN